MAQPTSSEPNLLQVMLTASRQDRAQAEEMIAASEIEKRIEAAKEDWITQARAEMEIIMSQANIRHKMIVSEKDSQIAALAAMNTALSSDLQKAKAQIPNADLQWMESMKKDAKIHKLRGQVRELEEKLTTTKEELRMKNWDLHRSQKTAEENFTACIRERENRHEKEIWLAEVNCRLEKERNALRDVLAKRDMAENRRIIKERAKIRASPKNPRRFSQASPIIIDEVPQTPIHPQANVCSCSGTIVRSRQKETPKKVKNTNCPKAIAKDDQRRNKAIEGVKGKEGAMFFKTLAVTSAIGLVGWAKEGGYF